MAVPGEQSSNHQPESMGSCGSFNIISPPMNPGNLTLKELIEDLHRKHNDIGNALQESMSNLNNARECLLRFEDQESMSNLNNARECLLRFEDQTECKDDQEYRCPESELACPSPRHELLDGCSLLMENKSPTNLKLSSSWCRRPEDAADWESTIPMFGSESLVGDPRSTMASSRSRETITTGGTGSEGDTPVTLRDFTKELDLGPKVSWVRKDLPEQGHSYLVNSLKSTIFWKCSGSPYRAFFEWSMRLKEPTRSGILFQLVSSNIFKTTCGAVIFLNGLFIVWATNYGIENLGEAPSWMENVELAFLMFYSLELFAKLIVHRCFFFLCEEWKWNVFDFGLVVFVALEMVASKLSKMQEGNSQIMNMTFLRVVRIIKVAKIMRMFRAMRFCSDIRLMLDCITGSVATLFWCLLVIVFVLYVYALYFVQSLTHFLDNKGRLSESHVLAIKQAFGSVQHAMLSLFQAVTGGIDWYVHYDLLGTSGGMQAGLYVFYIAFFVVVAWNIITSTFLEKATKIAKPDMDQLMFEKHRKDVDDTKNLVDLFEQMDMDRSTTISAEEFMHVTHDPTFQKFLQVRGIDIKDARTFWAMMMSVDECHEVDISTCVSSCLRMKGFATSIDLHTLGFEAKVMHLKCMRCLDQCVDHLERIQTHLGLDTLNHAET